MSQYPQDQFDEVPPYGDGEVGRHRAPVPEPPAAGGSRALRWVTLLAVFALLVGASSYFVLPRLPDSIPFVGGAGQSEEEPDGSTEAGEGSGEEADEDGDGSGEEQGEDSGEETPTAADPEAAVQIIDAGGPEGVLDDVESRLTAMDYNVTHTQQWEDSWGEVETPVIYYPSGQEEHARDLAEKFGVETVEQNDAWGYVALVVGSEQGE